MKPSRLVTSGGVRRHTVRGMRKITKAALVGGAAAAAIAATVGMASPANAYSYAHSVTTEITWGGSYCIPTWSAGLYNRYTTGFDTLCGGSRTFTEIARPGEWYGADPDMGNASWVACTTWVDGHLDMSDYASAGNGHEASCLDVM
jgi:hypothetical protein